MAYGTSTTGTGSLGGSGTASTTVPAGAAIDDIMLLAINIDNSATTFTWPAGFTQLGISHPSADGQTSAVAWKRLTAADSGSYSITCSTGGDWICQAARFSGRHTTTAPTASVATNNTNNPNPVSVDAATITAGAGDDLAWIGGLDVTASGLGNGCTPPASYAEAQDAENGWSNLAIATRDNASAGATGTVTGTFAVTSTGAGWSAFLVLLPTAGGGGGPTPAVKDMIGGGIIPYARV